MNLYAICTPSHRILRDQWLLPSIRGEYDARIVDCDQECPRAEYKSRGWARTVARKFDVLQRAVRENENAVFVFCDVDIQFLQPTTQRILAQMEGRDLLFLRGAGGECCTGFIACRSSDRTLAFWARATRWTGLLGMDDQDAVNMLLAERRGAFFLSCIGRTVLAHLRRLLGRDLLRMPAYVENDGDRATRVNAEGIRWGFLDPSFFSPSAPWRPGMPLAVPDGIAMHHANWTFGVQNKIAQLSAVRAMIGPQR